MSSAKNNLPVAIQSRCDVTPDEVRLHFNVSSETALSYFARGWILIEGDFNLAVRLGPRTWRGNRQQWEEIKQKTTPN